MKRESDERDAKIAADRLAEIEANPASVLRGPALDRRLEQLLNQDPAGATASPVGIASTETVGVPTLKPGGVTISPAGIAPTTAIGSLTSPDKERST